MFLVSQQNPCYQQNPTKALYLRGIFIDDLERKYPLDKLCRMIYRMKIAHERNIAMAREWPQKLKAMLIRDKQSTSRE